MNRFELIPGKDKQHAIILDKSIDAVYEIRSFTKIEDGEFDGILLYLEKGSEVTDEDFIIDDSKPDIYGTMTRRFDAREPAFSNPPRKG